MNLIFKNDLKIVKKKNWIIWVANLCYKYIAISISKMVKIVY